MLENLEKYLWHFLTAFQYFLMLLASEDGYSYPKIRFPKLKFSLFQKIQEISYQVIYPKINVQCQSGVNKGVMCLRRAETFIMMTVVRMILIVTMILTDLASFESTFSLLFI